MASPGNLQVPSIYAFLAGLLGSVAESPEGSNPTRRSQRGGGPRLENTPSSFNTKTLVLQFSQLNSLEFLWKCCRRGVFASRNYAASPSCLRAVSWLSRARQRASSSANSNSSPTREASLPREKGARGWVPPFRVQRGMRAQRRVGEEWRRLLKRAAEGGGPSNLCVLTRFAGGLSSATAAGDSARGLREQREQPAPLAVRPGKKNNFCDGGGAD